MKLPCDEPPSGTTHRPAPPRVLELFCGIGGCAAAVHGRAEVARAIDVDQRALRVYRHNFAHPTRVAILDSVADALLAAAKADLWWLSPPCQPYTVRGLGRDLDDPRARSLRHLIDVIDRARPPYLALENVPGFADSRARARLEHVLERAGYDVRACLLCPTELGIANRRRRFYLVAGRERLAPWPAPPHIDRTVDAVLDHEPDSSLVLDQTTHDAYRGALHVVDPRQPDAVATCFTSAYGRSPVRSGSYIRESDGSLRRFAPQEILRLLGFPPSFVLPETTTTHTGWHLAGNSLSIDCVRHVLTAIPALGLEQNRRST